jgi:molecular chaperone DnaK
MGEKTYTFTNKSGETFRPEEISALILSKLKADAEAFMGEEIAGAVITVPAYFADPQRQATKDAAAAANLTVLDMINEPTAAAIAFGISKDVSKSQTVMIYDFGGGTFDVSILKIDDSNIQVIATNGDHKLGGYDIDKAIYDYVVEEAKEENIDIESDPKARQSLMIAAETAKKELSSAEEADICIYVKGEEYETTIDRQTFEEDIAESILDTTLSIMLRTLEEANLTYEQIDKILLVGGSTRIPVIRKMLEEETGIVPSCEVHPDEAVAIGAAFHAVDVVKQMAEGTFKTEASTNADYQPPVAVNENDVPELDKNYNFQDVTSHAIGIVTFDSDLDKEVNSIILPKNTPIPAEYKAEYSTVVEYQEQIDLRVTSGEFENLDYVTIIGNATLKVRPRAQKVPIQVIVSCDRDAILHVRAIDLDEKTDLGEITINRDKNNMTEEEVKAAATRIHKLNIGE